MNPGQSSLPDGFVVAGGDEAAALVHKGDGVYGGQVVVVFLNQVPRVHVPLVNLQGRSFRCQAKDSTPHGRQKQEQCGMIPASSQSADTFQKQPLPANRVPNIVPHLRSAEHFLLGC